MPAFFVFLLSLLVPPKMSLIGLSSQIGGTTNRMQISAIPFCTLKDHKLRSPHGPYKAQLRTERKAKTSHPHFLVKKD